MPRIRYSLYVLLFGASIMMAQTSQDPYADRWAELRQRIAEGGDVSQLIHQWEPKSMPAMRQRSMTKNLMSSSILDPTRDRVRAAACAVGVRPSLALAIVEHETGFNNLARGEKGEIGAGQILPSTATSFGFDQKRLAADYDYNVQAAVGIMRYLLDYFDGDEDAVIRGYNGGPGWRNAGPTARGMIENYAASVTHVRSKYVPVTCG